MGGHLKELPARVAHKGGSRDVVDSRFLSHSLLDTPHELLSRHIGHVGPPTLAFIVFFPSCSRTPSLSQVIGAVAGAPGPLNLLGGDSGCCQLHALVTQVLQSCSHHWPLQVPLWGRLGEPPMGRMSLNRVTEHP